MAFRTPARLWEPSARDQRVGPFRPALVSWNGRILPFARLAVMACEPRARLCAIHCHGVISIGVLMPIPFG
jgi:hypothetical protein